MNLVAHVWHIRVFKGMNFIRVQPLHQQWHCLPWSSILFLDACLTGLQTFCRSSLFSLAQSSVEPCSINSISGLTPLPQLWPFWALQLHWLLFSFWHISVFRSATILIALNWWNELVLNGIQSSWSWIIDLEAFNHTNPLFLHASS